LQRKFVTGHTSVRIEIERLVNGDAGEDSGVQVGTQERGPIPDIPGSPNLPFVEVSCRVLAADGRDCIVALPEPPPADGAVVSALVPRALVGPGREAAEGPATLSCALVGHTATHLTVQVPGVLIEPDAARFVEVPARLPVEVRLALPPARTATMAVLVASKDGASTIGDTVRSTVGQADVFVVSDGSRDATATVAREAGARVLELETNVGKPAALRLAVDHFGLTRRYESLAILDDDTVIAEDFVDHATRALTPGVAIVVGQTLTRWDDDRRWNVLLGSRAYGYWRYQTAIRRGQSALNVMNCVAGSNSVYRSSVLDQVLVPDTPYIVDDTYWTLETHRRQLGRIVYAGNAKAWICDPTTLGDWYRQNLRWMWGTFQGVWGHGIGRRATRFDVSCVLLILDWVLFVFGMPALLLAVVVTQVFDPMKLALLHLAGYAMGAALGATVLRKWRLTVMTPAFVVLDWAYRLVFLHALVKTIRQPRVTSCRWTSPARY
jgi:poly-beta-1,6-N-acetyl-D-glucosamine synthase